MNTKITKIKIAEMFGYGDSSVFKNWKEKQSLKDRYEWLKTSAILMQNGFNSFEVLGMAEKVDKLEKKIAEYEIEIDKYLSKEQLLREIRK